MEEEVQEHVVAEMNAIASAIDQLMNPDKKNKKVGFMLLMFDFAGPKSNRVNYIANCDRKDGINAMKEFIARAERRISDSESLQ